MSASPPIAARSPADPLFVGPDGWYRPHDYWLSLCGLYGLYAFALERLGAVAGRSVLDCGCGHGQTSIMLAKRGARVTAFDTSEEDLAKARELAAANGVAVEFRREAFERLDLPDASFDLVFGACILHHVDIPAACREIQRVLKPGGRALFIENSARNPLLMAARRYVVGRYGIPRYGDDHEHPLTRRDLHAIASAFPDAAKVHYPDFLFFRLADFYVLRKRSALATWLLARADAICGRIPVVKRYGYFFVIEIERR